MSSSADLFFFSSRRRHTRWPRDWSSDVCSSDLSSFAAAKTATAAPAGAQQVADTAESVTEEEAPATAVATVEPGAYEGSVVPLADGSAPEGYTIKGNGGSMKYHTEDSPWFGRTKAEVWFATEEAAKAAGFVNAVKESPEADKAAEEESK